jgi:hypothetical protein
MERLKMENVNLKKFALEIQLQQVMAERAVVIRQLEESYPDYEWNEQFGLQPKKNTEAIEGTSLQ